ncbi:7SK snRNA methylphosphate capping enzyme [Alligator sinensis]|uniref:RNA methyltransferase n=1 Tax=Alligator sinensis TaxID=38654 RepID=A0A1U7SSW5_ALLSI|nr:7SK snRNA methylphosphate capping enzyme [Alligator sinensis]
MAQVPLLRMRSFHDPENYNARRALRHLHAAVGGGGEVQLPQEARGVGGGVRQEATLCRPRRPGAAPLGPRRAGSGPVTRLQPGATSEEELQRPRNGLQLPPRGGGGGGKRRNSCNAGFKHPASKRRRRMTSECDPVLPSEFLLGGNIFDPLNLNSLLDEEVNRALNAETPKSSPLPARGRDPVEILIPRDITDPLSLNADGDAGPLLASPAKAGRRRHRHRAAQRAGHEAKGATPQPYELNTAINSRDDVPQLPSAGTGEAILCPAPPSVAASSSSSRHHRKRRRTCSKSEGAKAGGKGSPERGRGAGKGRRQQQRRFQYGNYCKYYGYRNPGCEDTRLRVLKEEWFRGKEVLDVGCNVGHLTLSIARHLGPARIVGLDIDSALVHSARQNIRHYLSEEMERPGRGAGAGESGPLAKPPGFPLSLMASRGPIAAPRVPEAGADATTFPNNVIFVRGNYVLGRDELVAAQRPEYDVVLCLSLTKWVHLNWGDEGLKRLFKRTFRHLRPGGVLVLEPQPWSSYGKRKGLTETTYRNYYRIRLKPEQFPAYLTSPEVGFTSYELVATPHNTSKGFQRPVYLFHKAAAQ